MKVVCVQCRIRKVHSTFHYLPMLYPMLTMGGFRCGAKESNQHVATAGASNSPVLSNGLQQNLPLWSRPLMHHANVEALARVRPVVPRRRVALERDRLVRTVSDVAGLVFT